MRKVHTFLFLFILGVAVAQKKQPRPSLEELQRGHRLLSSQVSDEVQPGNPPTEKPISLSEIPVRPISEKSTSARTKEEASSEEEWVRLENGLYGGPISNFVEHNGKFIGGFYDGVYISSDQGNTWEKVEDQPDSVGIFPKVFKHESRVYLSSYYAIYYSDDGGSTWIQMPDPGHPAPVMERIDLYFFQGKIFAYADYMPGKGLWYTEDHGQTWKTSLIGTITKNGYTYTVHPGSVTSCGNYLFAESYQGVYRTTDLITWTPVNTGLSKYYTYGYYLDGIFTIGTSIFVYDPYGGGLKRSDNYGTSWVAANSGLPNPNSWFYSYVNDFYTKNNKIVIATNNGIFSSANNGSSWSKESIGYDVNFVSLIEHGGQLYSSLSSRGVFRSSDTGQTWLPQDNKGTVPWFQGIYEHTSGLYAFGWSGIFHSNDNGETWENRSHGIITDEIQDVGFINNRLVVGTYNDGIFYSDDYGITWTKSITPTGFNYVPRIFEFKGKLFCIVYELRTYLTSKGVWVSNDGGETWTKDGINFPNPPFLYGDYYSTDLQSNGDTLVLSDGLYGVSYSTDGATWTKPANKVEPNSNFEGSSMDNYGVKVHGNKLHLFTWYGLLTSYDYGENWQVGTNTPWSENPNVFSDVTDGEFIGDTKQIVGTWAGVWVSKDNGETYVAKNEGFGAFRDDVDTFEDYTIIVDLLTTPKDAFAIPYEGGVWRRSLNSIFTPVTFTVESTSDRKNRSVAVPVKVKNFKDITGFQFNIEWDTSVITYKGIEQFELDGLDMNSFGLTEVSNGKIIVSWSAPGLIPQTLISEDSIFDIKFTLTGVPGDSTPVTITQHVEVIGADFEELEYELIAGNISIYPTVSVAGKVTHHGQGLSTVSIDMIESDNTYRVNTDTDGEYSQILPSDRDYTISASKATDASTYLTYLNAADLAAMQRHILQTEILTDPYSLIAADVNASGSVTTLDKILATAVILNIQGFADNAQWKFILADYDTALDPFSYPKTKNLPNLVEDVTQDFVAVHLGDVLNSQSNTGDHRTTKQPCTFEISSSGEQLDGEVNVVVRGYGFFETSAFQIAFGWNEDLTFTGLEGRAISPEMSFIDNVLRLVWDDAAGKTQSFSDGTALFVMKFKVNGNVEKLENNLKTSTTLSAQVYNQTLQENAIAVRWSQKDEDFVFSVGDPYPNPFDKSIHLIVTVQKEGEIKITLMDVEGRYLSSTRNQLEKGVNTISWKGADDAGNELAKGFYFMKVQVGRFTKTVKVIKN